MRYALFKQALLSKIAHRSSTPFSSDQVLLVDFNYMSLFIIIFQHTDFNSEAGRASHQLLRPDCLH